MDVIIAEKPTIAYIIASALGADKKEDVGNRSGKISAV